ncbi:GlxA family transcriptional regulator [Massilia sp. SM-13]|uniref:GlxA family transcriptional regulator n=1 Tax=Pseudoduganella rhizocola TaxID=3382643 RepID=UPI0038B5DDBC
MFSPPELRGREAATPPAAGPQTIALYCSEGSSAIDVAAIAAVFAQANRLDGRHWYEIVLVAPADTVLLADGVRLGTRPFAQLAVPIDTLVLSGALPAENAVPGLRRWLAAQLQQARRWCAVDGGLLALAQLGLGRDCKVSARAGTRFQLEGMGVAMQIDETVLFQRDGRLWSCPGGAPVLDMCLDMVEQDCGRRLANLVARHLLVAGRRSSAQAQVSPVLAAQSRGGRDRELAQLVEWVNQNIDSQLDIAAMATRVSMSERNFHRRFKAFTGFTPVDYVTQVRLERARQLLMCDLSLKEVAKRTGFTSATTVRRALRRRRPDTPDPAP